jgi:alpha-glucosidase (family GH31 glycosyl hydrolase)
MASGLLCLGALGDGVYRVQVGGRDLPTLTDAAGSHPKQDRLVALGSAGLPFELGEIRGHRFGDRTSVSLPLAPGEKIFGLGLQMSGMDRRGEVFHLRVDHYSEGHDRLHVPTPLYVSSLGYAVFFNTSRAIDIYVGVGNRLDDPKLPPSRDRNTDPKWDGQPDSGHVEASVQGPGLEVLVFSGPTAMNALQRYNLYCGGGALPPLWALGFWDRTPSLATAQDVLGEADEYRKRGFPLDVIGLEPGWESRSYPGTMEWSPQRFPDPAGFLKRTEGLGLHVNLWENPYVAPGSKLYEALAPNFGSHTVWLGAVPDLREKPAAEALAKFHTDEHLRLGVSGYKIDEIDGFDNWLWPDHAEFPSGLDGLRMRQIYGLLWQNEIEQWFRKENRRTFGLIRGSNGAASRFPFAIYSDTYDHRQYVAASLNASLAGVLWCAEAREASSPEEWVRRIQSACFSPIAQLNAWSSGAKPWNFPEVEGEVKKSMLLRESLAPYLYTAFSQYWRDGIPPIRPMSLVDGGLETDQYMLGDSLLVAPMFAGEKERKIRLPKGRWFDFESGTYVGGGETVTLQLPLNKIPVFVKGSAAIPMFADGVLNLSSLPKEAPYVIRRYGPGPWKAVLYEDDGTSFAYEHGAFGLFEISAAVDGALTLKPLAGEWRELRRRISLIDAGAEGGGLP